MTYPAFVTCPYCGLKAANLTLSAPAVMAYSLLSPERLDRFVLRTDQDKPGPSHRLIVCQHCHDSFRASPRLIHSNPEYREPTPARP